MAFGTSTYSAWQPSIVLPKRQPPIGLPAALRLMPVEAGVALSARGDRAGDHALADRHNP